MKKALIINIIFLVFFSACNPSAKTTAITRNVYYAGGNYGVKAALIKAGFKLVDAIDKAEVFVLNGEIPFPYTIHAKLEYGAGLVLIPGENVENYGSDMDAEALLGQPVADLFVSDNPVSLEVDDFFGKDDSLITEIDWTTAPQIRERAWLSAPGPGTPLIRVAGYTETVLGEVTDRNFKLQAYYLSAYIDDRHNLEFQEWKYFDYLIYHLVERAAGAKPMTFEVYSAHSH